MKYKIAALLLVTFVLLFFIIKKPGIKSEITIDFEQDIGKIGMDYGANEDSWQQFTQDSFFHALQKDIGSKYIRVWVLCVSHMKYTMPYDGVNYNFFNLDSYIDAVLDSAAIPYIVFANGIESCGGEAQGNPPPSDYYEYADYVEAVVKHFKEKCSNELYSKPSPRPSPTGGDAAHCSSLPPLGEGLWMREIG